MDDDSVEYELVMPFVVVTSKGGPYDDEAFAAGWACAEIDQALKAVAPWNATFARTIRTTVVPQVDLIAMKHGYQLTYDEDADRERGDGWTLAAFSPLEVSDGP